MSKAADMGRRPGPLSLPLSPLLLLLSASLTLPVPSSSLSSPPQAAFREASLAGGGGAPSSGIVESQPNFFVNESAPHLGPPGAPPEWPLSYDRFREREVARDLVRWFKANGVFAIGDEGSAINIEINYNTSLRASGKSRGDFRLVARHKIPSGEMFASLPLSLAMTPDIAKAGSPTPIADQVIDYSAVAAWLLREKAQGEASPWHAYIQSLPQHIPVPFLYPEDLLAVSEYPYFINETKEHKEFLDQQFALLGPEAVGYANMSQFIWAFAAVASRALGLPANGKLPTYYTQKVVPATPEALAAAEKAHRESAKAGGGGGKQGKGLSWEDEFLFDDGELEELKAVAEGGGGGQQQQQEEEKTVSVLLPLMDLFDFDEEANIRFEFVGSSLALYATADIPRGAPLFLRLRDAQSEMHLIERGFVPAHNPHDGAFLFRDRDETIHYFREKFLSGKFNQNYYAVMDDTFDIAEEFLKDELAKPKYRGKAGTSIEYQAKWGRHFPSFAWWGARLDAHVFAAIAAGQSMTVRNYTPNYRDLAPAALAYAWILREHISCDSLAEVLIDLESDAFPTAGTTIRFRIVELLRGFKTNVEQDQQLLLALNMCRELAVFGRTSTGQDFHLPAGELLRSSCPEILQEHLAEIEALYRLRLSKKTVYLQLLARLEKTCELV